MKHSVVVRVSVGTLFLMLSAVALFGQSERGTITGTVTDSTGAAVPQAKITATSDATNVAATTSSNDAGDYTLPNLPAGQYTVPIEDEGFSSSVRSAIKLAGSASARADDALALGSAQRALEVSAMA